MEDINEQTLADSSILVEMTAEVVSAYVSNNTVSAGDLPGLIDDVHYAFIRIGKGENEPQIPPQEPAVNPKKSVTRDYIICLEDGKKFKSLKRHLKSQYDMSPDEYREKWNLSPDYPMVAPSYSERRSKLARERGLGRKKAPANA